MIDNILPEMTSVAAQQIQKRAKSTKSTKSKKSKQPIDSTEVEKEDDRSAGSWSPSIQINRAVWHPSIRRSHLLLTGMNNGLVRLDMVEGSMGQDAQKVIPIKDVRNMKETTE